MQIDQASQRAIINWDSFSIGSGAHVNFSQPGAASVALNRVLGNDPSQIFGRLTANGQVFLANPAGVLFAPGASVEVGSLLATTLSISDQDFLNGVYRFQNAGGAASVVNKGNIKIATPNDYAALAGPRIENSGMIVAELGTVAFAAGDRVTLDMVGDALINVSVDQSALNASIVNSGTIEANGGRVLMTARTANTLLDTVINSSGVIRANRLAERDGEVVLDGNGRVDVAGIIEASGTINVNMPESPGPVIQPIPPIVPLPPLQPGKIVFQEPFTIGSSNTITLSGAGIPLDSLNRVAVTSATLSVSEMTGSITLGSPAGQAVPPGGSILVTNTDIGRVAPMQHSIVGAGVTLPTEGFFIGR